MGQAQTETAAVLSQPWQKQADTKEGARLGSEKPYRSLHLCQVPCTRLTSQCEKEDIMKVDVYIYTRVRAITYHKYVIWQSPLIQREENKF